MKYITYGFNWDPNKFRENIKNHPFLNKPLGGLWGSPINSEYGWKDWCIRNSFKPFCEKSDIYFEWELMENRNILIVETEKDIPENLYRSDGYLDWEKVSQEYDAFFLTLNGLNELEDSSLGFNTWDCESIIVFKKDLINPLEITRKPYIW